MKTKNKFIPIFKPFLKGNEKKYLNQCIETNWISSQGDFVKSFEKKLAKFHNTKYCVATSNCTSALHLSLLSIGIGKGSEVLCPALSFIAPANMILLSGAKLVLVDIDPISLTIDPNLIERKITKKTKAILVVHQFGHSAHMDEIMQIAKKHKLKVIEDNAESLGGLYKNKMLGTIGHLSTFSFFSNKIITSGEGGAVITNNKNLANKIKVLRDHGMSLNKKYLHTNLGFNYRMTNMQAAIAIAQLEKLKKIFEIRNKQLEIYDRELSSFNQISIRSYYPWTTKTHWLYTITFKDFRKVKQFIEFMKSNNIECRNMVPPINKALHIKNKFKNNKFSVSELVSKSSVHLPSSTSLSQKEILYICSNIKKFLNHINE